MDRPQDKKKTPAERPGAAAPPAPPLDAAEVAAYLRQHPDFLIDHPTLMQVLTPPTLQRGERVIDMQQFMLQHHRAEIARLKGQQRALLVTSRANLTSQARIHSAVLALLSAQSFEQLLQTVTTDLAVLLDADVVTIGVETAGGQQARLPLHGIQLLATGMVERVLGADRDVRLHAEIPGDPALFGSGAGLVHSAALLRLSVSPKAPAGLLCIGSRRVGKFNASQGTELLGFLAHILEITIAGWLDLPA